MEEQLKARLIGAVVLVALAVLLIPELLSGRKPPADTGKAADVTRGTRTYVIDLGGAVAAGARLEPATQSTARPPLPTASATPAPVPAKASAPDEADSRPEQPLVLPPEAAEARQSASAAPAAPATVAKATAAPPQAAPTPPKPAAGSGKWAVQVGAFSSAASARKLVGELQRDGFAAYEAPLRRSGKTLHRVRVGPEADKAAADKLSARLKNRGLPATVVTND
jgi:DedD protein